MQFQDTKGKTGPATELQSTKKKNKKKTKKREDIETHERNEQA